MYQIKPISFTGNHTLLKQNQKILDIKYSSWRLNNAQTFYKNQKVVIEESSDSNKIHQITKDGVKVGHLAFDRKMALHMYVSDQHQDKKHLIFHSKGFWNYKFELSFADLLTPIIQLQPKVNWKNVKTTYQVKVVSATHLNFDIPELLIYSSHAINMLASHV